ncbi:MULTISPECIES: FAD-dependent oxidoreductase [unclassified Micromonospora]|uniref:FAD-dependent oxidoreductase n=1 Tax=unclassified Micromonospora TaxID=2617518 RepID=UPI0011040996
MTAEVLVVGAGVAGLALAGHLQDRGISVQVVERAARLRTARAGIVLHPNALASLGRLREDLVARGAALSRQVAIDPDGRRSEVRWDLVWGELGLPLAVHRRVLSDLLFAAIAPGTVRFGTAPTSVAEEDDGVQVGFDDGSTGRYRLVAGADGIGSWVRGRLAPGIVPAYSGHTFVRTTVAMTEPERLRDWHVWRTSRSFLGAMPVGGDRAAVFLQLTAPEPLRLTPEQARREVLDAVPRLPAEVGRLFETFVLDDEVVARPAATVTAPRMTGGRLALLGDAARALSPATSQGGGMAVEDAAVLADEVARHGCGSAALSAYERRRRPRVDSFLRSAHRHLVLMSAVQHDPDLTRRQSHHQDASSWFRRLYMPLTPIP